MRVGVLGAGLVGCYLGGLLRSSDVPVTLVLRARMRDSIEREGLWIRPLGGDRVPCRAPALAEDARALSEHDLILVTVKTFDLREALEPLRAVLAPGATVVLLQNGLGLDGLAREILPDANITLGMVPFNVVREPGGSFAQSTSGPLALDTSPALDPLARALKRAHLPVFRSARMRGVLAAKLIFNLNNALNALTGMPLREQLESAPLRGLLADLQGEALRCYDAAGIRPVAFGRMRPRLAPHILRLPTPAFRRVAGAMLKIDERARSSMFEDLERRRRTEIRSLNGAIVDLATSASVSAPLNEGVVELVERAESGGNGSPRLSSNVLCEAVRHPVP